MTASQVLSATLPFWEKLSEQDREMFSTGCLTKSFAKGEIINRFDEGCQGAILLQNGQIRIYIVSDEGREVTLYRLHTGDICVLSASCLLDSIAFDVAIEAMERTEALLLPSAALHQVMERNPYVDLFLAKTANERFSDVMWTMQRILFCGADRRVAAFLWDEMIKTGRMSLSYTHDEIARCIGSAREVVTRILKYFAQEGILALERGKVLILDREKLQACL
ncbi:CRP/FNR family transcriptional regulator, anaerobic regulatory protein [Oscillibacter sp. PC13]|uniref:Crp/Fnr family transcriptional regulator n=1 Tax=Oscillibacter sp. PC13 TaxID=1855299 RepID=UPI0008DED252|nr:Crp/Fnr family transcriptional regulator [Oscillibacter sp. PC13]SFP35057.1 CRP/FNR family transcriptional regulator, anaerobic regulatory protein [Oscillibacter sp. PC13]